MSTPNLDNRYTKPTDVAAAISTQAATDAGQYTQKWKANTAYTSGQIVVAPDGSIISATTGFTSGATYSASNWTTLTPTAATIASTYATSSSVTSAIATQATTDAGQYALKASPAITGTPTVPTATAGTNTTQIASTAFVTAATNAVTTSTPIKSLHGRVIACIGDSNSQRGNSLTPTVGQSIPMTTFGSSSTQSYLASACLLSGGRLLYGGAYATGGQTSSYMLINDLPLVLLAKPHYCVVLLGTNDNTGMSGAPSSADGTIANLKSIYTQLSAAGIMPILVTLPPKADTGWQQKVNMWIRYTATQYGYPFVDLQEILANADGTWKTGLNDSGDGLHMTVAATQLFAQAIVNTLAADLNTVSSPLLGTQLTTDSTQIISNPLFLTSTGGNNIPNGWGGGGSPTFTLAADATTPTAPRIAYRGNVMSMTRASADASYALASIPVVPGNQMLIGFGFSCSINAANAAASATNGYADVRVLANDYSSDWLSISASTDVPAGSAFCGIITVPAGKTTARVMIDASNVTNVNVRLAQLTLIDLTAQNLLV